MKIALVQCTSRLGDLEANLAETERHVAAAAAAGADVALFPELALSGYRLRDIVPEVAVRLDREGPARERLLALSRTLPFLVGLVEETADHRFHNAAAYFEDGRLVHVHRKCHLPTYGMFDEAMDFAPGERLAAFDTRFGRVGALICEDVWHPAAAMVLAQDGATMLWVVAASPLRGLGAGTGLLSADSVRGLVQVVARFNVAPACYCNRSGFEEGIAFSGASFAVGAGGQILAEAPALEPALVVAEIDQEETRLARAAYPLVRDERIELLRRELRRIARRRAGEDLP
ncbi:carbon-nitrogen hydrolase [bacterium]|nr:carbon-nitrogen hydrolase [bacterium]